MKHFNYTQFNKFLQENSQDSPNMRHRHNLSSDSNADQIKSENNMNSLTANSIIK